MMELPDPLFGSIGVTVDTKTLSKKSRRQVRVSSSTAGVMVRGLGVTVINGV